MKKDHAKKRYIGKIIVAFLFGAAIMAFIRYISYGGMNSGTQVNNEEFLKVAEEIDDIAIPENVKIFALGEATHGNKEFQELKLDLFRKMVEEYNCKAFALEADYGGCLLVNQYIHGEGKFTEDDAVKALAFHIYQTDEMRALIRYMADYNKQAKPEEMLSFYGFDMQNSDLDQKCVDEAFSELKMQYTDMEDAAETLKNIPGMEMYAQAARCYLQNQELSNASNVDYAKIRDHYMAENIDWIYEHVQKANESMLMISGHNGHVAKKSTYTTFMGEELFEKYGDDYFVIGTDFYKTECNLPGKNGKRITRKFYSADPLANTAHALGMDITYLDFNKLQKSEKIKKIINQSMLMGSLGEGYSFLNKILPNSYRINDVPAELYDGMIIVINASPTDINH